MINMDRTAAFYWKPTYVQRGAGLPVYSGSRRQRGGSVLGALKGFVMPALGAIKRSALRRVKAEAFGLAKDVARDAMSGRNILQSAKTRGIQRAKRLGKGVLSDAVGSVSRKRKAPANKRSAKRRRTQNF